MLVVRSMPPRKRCVQLASNILRMGCCCIIDRCGVEPSQRDDFVVCAQSHGCQVRQRSLTLLITNQSCGKHLHGEQHAMRPQVLSWPVLHCAPLEWSELPHASAL